MFEKESDVVERGHADNCYQQGSHGSHRKRKRRSPAPLVPRGGKTQKSLGITNLDRGGGVPATFNKQTQGPGGRETKRYEHWESCCNVEQSTRFKQGDEKTTTLLRPINEGEHETKERQTSQMKKKQTGKRGNLTL